MIQWRTKEGRSIRFENDETKVRRYYLRGKISYSSSLLWTLIQKVDEKRGYTS